LINKWKGGVYNLTTPDHPKKNEYYIKYASGLGINIPEFNKLDSTKGKLIQSNKLKELNFEFKYKRLSEFPLIKLK
jgi:hypothetical protein